MNEKRWKKKKRFSILCDKELEMILLFLDREYLMLFIYVCIYMLMFLS